ncbi:MAG: hypothetical protein PWQ28_607 [Candidatus Woesearchaeota archaeon]|nr:hypothetical protein [Candidatus Woesearchaeota archaeon]
MAKKVARVGIKKEKGYLYFVDKNGNVARVPMARGKNVKKGKAQVVATTNIKKEDGYLYFVDKDGDVAQAKMARGRKKKR